MKRKIDYIVIHCTATHPGATVDAIQNYWKRELGWRNPGYHFLITTNGTIHKLHDLDKVANGVAGYNSRSIHISYIGGRDHDTRTPEQKASIIECITMAQSYAAPHIPIIQGHRDFPNVSKACPQFDARAEYQHLRGL